MYITLYAAAARLFWCTRGGEPKEKVKMHKSLDPLPSPPRAKVIRRHSVKASSDIIIITIRRDQLLRRDDGIS